MAKSNRLGGFGRRTGTVTVIEESVHRSSVRKAKIVFWVVWVATGLLAATVAASTWHPLIALLAGALIGLAAAAVTAALVLIWPVIRAVWWWAPEIALTLGLGVGWIDLADHTTLLERIGTVALVAGVPGVIRPVRARLVAAWWCLTTRHRLRTCFSEFIITNRTGSLPFILWARPTQVGERVWIWLRPGLALDDIQARTDKIAVACWADTAVAEPASQANSAYVRMDIKRRDALTAPITSPLLGLIRPGTPARNRDATDVPTALDLPDVRPGDVTPARPAVIRGDRKAPASAPAAPDGGSEINDWI